MQKTIKYNLDESYAQGYNDARDEIAKEIKILCNCVTKSGLSCWHDQAANIAKGQK